ncbi:R3H domain-containing protein 4-like [Trifolium pratense]|uniref:Uncharacterized protein n=2 Tax=Trifolium pratense TaxID=57577 RepID=A0ACB0I736_TRIPR|nr:R3H domain-containing protein 4-like [Trifolium pratense]XP_045819158.1 R3H domain-containing protein 4-like [Trifolium pratense]XP_045832674.1 R3H domain-containing protein 4-like [Trifolium pratense]CAJ2627882.1 unnamed protein product [Trifolium pratense]
MVLQHRDLDLLLSSHLIDHPRGDGAKSHSISIEKKIEFLESFTGKVTNRRSRRWLNDRLLMELVPRLNAEEIRGLFAPPPWGDEVPPSTFSMTNVEEWDRFRNIDMDKEVNIIHAFEKSLEKKEGRIDADKMEVLNGWRRVGCRTRDALRRSSLFELVEGYEECLRAFITESTDGDVLELKIKDPFHRLLLHGVCEFYNLASDTVSDLNGTEASKLTKIQKKKKGSPELPKITLSHFLRMSKDGSW